MNILTTALIGLYTLSILTSMAAMEVLGWLLVLLAAFKILVQLVQGKKLRRDDLRLTPGCKTGIDFWVLLLFTDAVIGALLQDRAPWWKVAGEARWFFLLYAFNYHLRSLPKEKFAAGFRLFAWPVAAAGLYGIIQFFTGLEFFRSKAVLYPAGDFWRATGFYSVSLTYGCAMAMAVGLVGAYYVLNPNKRSSTLPAVALLGGVLGLFAGQTRGTWAGIVAATCLALVMTLKKKAIAPIAIGLVAVGGLLSLDASNRARLVHAVDINSASYTQRFAIWRANFEMFKDHPLFGVGYAQSSQYVREYYAKLGIESDLVSHAHNIYVQMLSTTGLVGLLSYLAICLGFLNLAWALYRRTPAPEWPVRAFGLGAFIALVAFHIAGLTEANFTDSEITHFVVFIWANLAALNAGKIPKSGS